MVNCELKIVCLEPWFFKNKRPPWRIAVAIYRAVRGIVKPHLSRTMIFLIIWFTWFFPFCLFVSGLFFNHANHEIILIMVQDFCFVFQTDSPPKAEPRSTSFRSQWRRCGGLLRRPDASGLLAMTFLLVTLRLWRNTSLVTQNPQNL